jgi:aryl-alcohol dehydrogenase-like predicted oxidoreductase
MSVETMELRPGYRISRLLRGGWQLAGGHGDIDRAKAIRDMVDFVDRGVTAFDCADIYTGVEEMIGEFRAAFRAERGAEALRRLKVHTKFVPDWDMLGKIDRPYVERIIDRSLTRLKAERLDLVQFHWWNYQSPGMVETALILKDLQQAGKIDLIGGTNFDTAATAAMAEAGVPLASMQSQVSLLDRRTEKQLAALAAAKGFRFLCYGTLAGGFLSERWLGAPEPAEPFANRSLVKYKLIIDDFGGWALFQRLLEALKQVADRHATGIPAVAIRWTLDRPMVAGCIVGARYADQLGGNLGAFGFTLDARDHAAIDAVLADSRPLEGDVYTLERDRDGRHGRIMKYNLNKD